MTTLAEPSTPSGSSPTTKKATDHELQKHDNFTRYGQHCRKGKTPWPRRTNQTRYRFLQTTLPQGRTSVHAIGIGDGSWRAVEMIPFPLPVFLGYASANPAYEF
jgi:hypothetical protein